MRCLALEQALRARGAKVRFACQDLPGLPSHRVIEAGVDLILLPPGEPDIDPWKLGWQSSDQRVDAVITDHYDLDAAWERRLRSHCDVLVAIDDLANRPREADLLVDATPDRRNEDYRNLVPSTCRLLTGPEHALIDPRFALARPASLSRRIEARCEHIVISLGGGNPGGIIADVISALAGIDLPRSVSITTVLGAAVAERSAIELAASTLPWRHRFLSDIRDMPGLLVEADLVIGAGGSSSWERCCLGVPTVVLVLADNQAEGAEKLSNAGAVVVVDRSKPLDDGLRRAITSAMTPGAINDMSSSASRLCDGLGADRVADAIAALMEARLGSH
jgi:UDP-2,4-diacetamido-2,4,6-trideoxy-beta-L-altropyranose hydrolase